MDVLPKPDFNMGPLLATFLIGIATILLVLWYSSKKQSYWKNLGITYVKPLPIVGSLMENFGNPLHDVELARYRKYGRIYGHYEGNRALLSVAEPELLRNILVKDFPSFASRRSLDTGDEMASKMVSVINGEDWKRLRTIITPTFTTGKIKRMLSIFKDCARTLVQNFKPGAETGTPVEAKTIYGAFTMDVIASSAFSTKLDSHNDPNNKFVRVAKMIFSRNINWRFALFILAPWFMKFFRISLFTPKVMDFFKTITLQIIEERKRTGQTRNDFLQLMLDTEKEVSDEGKHGNQNEKDDITVNYGEDENTDIFKQTSLTKKTLSHNELIANCIIFFLAGYDTTASTLSFATYLMALNPDVQEKVIEEVDNALRENNGELTYDTIQNMKYLDNVISETLRLYPPAIRLERMADEDYKLGDTGITVPKGMILTIPSYAIHRDPEFFPNPEKFDPNRFTPGERAKRNQYSYLPFGAGPRNCVGMRFALMEVKVCLIYVMSNFRIKTCKETKIPLEWYTGQGLLQPKDIMLRFEVRKDTVKAL